MKIDLVKRLQLFIVFTVVSLLWLVDRFTKPIVRTFAIFALALVVLMGFNIEDSVAVKSIHNLPLLFSDSPEVLGTKVISYPVYREVSEFPELTSNSVFVADLINNKILVDVNGEQRLAPASTTKLMTALVASDIYKMTDYLEVPDFCTEVEGQKSGFKAGEIYMISELMKGLLINSSADAACALSISRVNYPEFISLMNEKATEFGMENTNFTNPIGLDGENGDHFSTAFDLYKLSRKTIDNSYVESLVKTKNATVVSTEGRKTNIWNTNRLLWEVPGSVGIKTGTTEEAGEVLIYRYNVPEVDLLIIVMGSDDRFLDTQKVLNWTLLNYSWGV